MHVYFMHANPCMVIIEIRSEFDSDLKEEVHPKPKLSMFFSNKNYEHFLENDISILKQIFWKKKIKHDIKI